MNNRPAQIIESCNANSGSLRGFFCGGLALGCLIFISALRAQENPPNNNPAPLTPQNVPARPAAVEGISDDFPVEGEKFLPENSGQTPATAPVESREETPVKEPSKSSTSVWESISNKLGSDRTILNAIVVVSVILIFVLYRLRSGRTRRN